MNPLIYRIATEQIENAITQMRDPKFGKKIELLQYPKYEVGDPVEITAETASYTLPDLYREMARRIELGIDTIRRSLKDAEKVFDTLE